MIDRLQGFYGFTRMPFGRDLAPGMLHRHAAHGEAVARISWCITEHRIGVITGEVGAGKTVAVRAALAALDPTRHTIIYLPNPTVGVRGIHHQIVTALGAPPATHHATLVPQTVDALAVEQAERGRTPVLVIDEAHLLDHAQLESIRMLTNHDMDSTSPFACLLVGQPTLRRRIKLGVLAALDQRIGLRYAMPPMTPEETGSYLRHHLALAGRSDTLFSDDADHADPPDQPRLPPRGQQPRRPSPRRRVRRRQGHRRRVLHPRRRRRGHRRMTPHPAAPSRPPRHPDDQAPSGTSPTGPAHVPDVGTLNDAVVCTLSGGQHSITNPDRRASALTAVARALAQTGQHEQAAVVAAQAESVARSITNPDQQASALTEVAQALAQTGNTTRARSVAAAVSVTGRWSVCAGLLLLLEPSAVSTVSDLCSSDHQPHRAGDEPAASQEPAPRGYSLTISPVCALLLSPTSHELESQRGGSPSSSDSSRTPNRLRGLRDFGVPIGGATRRQARRDAGS